jgi:hypothetical protein
MLLKILRLCSGLILRVTLSTRLDGTQRWFGWFEEENLFPVAENRTGGDHSSGADGPGFWNVMPSRHVAGSSALED